MEHNILLVYSTYTFENHSVSSHIFTKQTENPLCVSNTHTCALRDTKYSPPSEYELAGYYSLSFHPRSSHTYGHGRLEG